MQRDLITSIKPVEILPPVVYAADNTPVAIDCREYGAGFVMLHIGIGGITFSGANKIEFIMTHSDDDSTYTAVAQADVQGVTVGAGGIVHSLIVEQAAAEIVRIGYSGEKRYVKILADFSGTHGTGTPLSAVMIFGYPSWTPVS